MLEAYRISFPITKQLTAGHLYHFLTRLKRAFLLASLASSLSVLSVSLFNENSNRFDTREEGEGEKKQFHKKHFPISHFPHLPASAPSSFRGCFFLFVSLQLLLLLPHGRFSVRPSFSPSVSYFTQQLDTHTKKEDEKIKRSKKPLLFLSCLPAFLSVSLDHTLSIYRPTAVITIHE